MDIKQLREAAGITETYKSSKKQAITETFQSIDLDQLNEEQLNELLGGLKGLAAGAWNGVKQAGQAAAQKVTNGIEKAAGAVNNAWEQGEAKQAGVTAVKALAILAKQNPQVFGPLYKQVLAAVQQTRQPQQQIAPQQGSQQAKPKVTPQQAQMMRPQVTPHQ